MTMTHLGAPSAQAATEIVQLVPAQNEGLLVAWFIAVWKPGQVLDVQALITANAAPACAAALTDIFWNIPPPMSAMPRIKVRKIGAKIAASTAAVASVFRNRRRRMRIMVTDKGMGWRIV